MAGTLREHGAILDAIRKGYPGAADRAMAEHMRLAGDRLKISLTAEAEQSPPG